VHVSPFSDFGQSCNVIVGDIHTAGVSNDSVYHYYLAVVTMEDVIDLRKFDGVEFYDFDTFFPDGLDVSFFQGAIVGTVPERVEHGSDHNAFPGFPFQDSEQRIGDGVVSEIEVFQMDVMFGLFYLLEQVDEFFVSALQNLYFIVGSCLYAILLQVGDENGITVCCGALYLL